MKYCPGCGTVMSDDAVFCRQCGRKMRTTKNSHEKTKPRSGYRTQIVILTALICVLSVSCMVVGILLYRDLKNRKTQEQLLSAEQYLKEQDYQQAENAYKEAVRTSPQNKEAYKGLAETYKQMADQTGDEPESVKMRKKAVEAYEKALEIDNEDEAVRNEIIIQYNILLAYAEEHEEEALVRETRESIEKVKKQETKKAPKESEEKTEEGGFETDKTAEKSAYLDILKEYQSLITSWEERLKEYNKGMESAGSNSEYIYDDRQVAITDINGDGADELLFVADTDIYTNDEGAVPTEDLYIFTYQNARAVKIYQERVFTEAAGGYRYLVVRTQGGQLVILDTAIDAFEDCTLSRYSFQDNQLKLEDQQRLLYNPYHDVNESMCSIDMGEGYTDVTEDVFESKSQKLSLDFETVLLKSGGGLELSIYEIQDRQDAIAMTHAEACEYLGGNAETGPAASDDLPQESSQKIHEGNYDGYKEVIDKLENQYGTLALKIHDEPVRQYANGSDYIVEALGLCYLSLIDFNNDGIKELLTITKHETDSEYTVEVYADRNGKVVPLISSTKLADVPWDDMKCLCLLSDKDGNAYIDRKQWGGEWDYDEIYGYDRDEFKLLSASCRAYNFEKGDWDYFIVGEVPEVVEATKLSRSAVSWEKYQREAPIAALTADVDSTFIYLMYPQSDTNIEKKEYSELDPEFLQNSIDGVKRELQSNDESGYGKIIEEYHAAYDEFELYEEDPGAFREKYPLLNIDALIELYLNNVSGLYSSCIDLNADGVEELLIGFGYNESRGIVSIYTQHDDQIIPLLNDVAVRSSITIFKDGTILRHDSGGAMYGVETVYEISAAGDQLNTIKVFETNWEKNPDKPYFDGTEWLSEEQFHERYKNKEEVELQWSKEIG